MPARFWLPPVLWMALIFLGSTDLGSGAHTSRLLDPLVRWVLPTVSPTALETLLFLVRKAGHLTEYGILAALWFRAFYRGRGLGPPASAWAALAVCVVWAALDEAHQSFVPSRTPTAVDVVIDTIGAGVALLLARVPWRGRAAAPTEQAPVRS